MSLSMTSDERDLADARLGGEEGERAFARLYDRHAPVVRALCRRNVATDSDADDALQECFLRAYRMLDRIEDARFFRPWLYRIAANVCSERRRSASRRARHEREAAMNHLATSAQHAGHAGAAGATESAERAEALDRLSAALDALPERERLAIHLHYLERDPVRAASEALNLSRSGFYKLLARAKEHLGTLMNEAAAP